MNFPCRTPFSSLPQPIISPLRNAFYLPIRPGIRDCSWTRLMMGWCSPRNRSFSLWQYSASLPQPPAHSGFGLLFCFFFYLRKPLSKNGKQKREKRFFFACVCVCVRVGGYFCFYPICHYFCKAENNPRATRKMGSEKADASHETLVWSETPFPSQINTGGKTAGSLEIKSDEVTQES